MSAVWQVQEAKNHFSELIERALSEGPQTITRHGKPVVRVVAVGDDMPTAPSKDDGFVEFLLNAPKIEGGLPEMPRDISSLPPLFGED
ncbi:MAG TPA: type II toxin-antitoxin system Phd/YefM family antitoxin [Comamonadaceae bacterium]|uniref:type II toxin-antitoxin system Phd/YefM family antitoxin n=1 Tax=Pulveribacter sp. TaxID=2678893 RepID=UPI000EEFD86B|nr:type II toxin-antitoxin system prevent-host-death family antitoxin [Pulveribacter sp.]HCL86946.1 type II toxin-antitoxin system Phd/YefM family antitoxin [Comamonadaceae bacterium]